MEESNKSQVLLFDSEKPPKKKRSKNKKEKEKTERDPLDRYYTPLWVTNILLDRYGHMLGDVRTCLEPFAGEGHISSVLTDRGFKVTTAEYSPLIKDVNFPETDSFRSSFGDFDAVITNPPYSTPLGNFEDALRVFRCKGRVFSAFLGWMSWINPTKERSKIMKSLMPTHLLVLPRFTMIRSSGTFMYNSAWFIYDMESMSKCETIIDFVSYQEGKAALAKYGKEKVNVVV